MANACWPSSMTERPPGAGVLVFLAARATTAPDAARFDTLVQSMTR